MECVRCKKNFDSVIAELNAEQFGNNICACPHCGKAYYFERIMRIKVTPIDNTYHLHKTDDWGERIVSDEEYAEEAK